MDRASRLRMSYTEMLLRAYARKMMDACGVVTAHERVFEKPRPALEGVLRGILESNASSEYGRAHGFAGLRSYDEFRERVPVVAYDDIHPLVERMVAGERDVLVRGAASYFSTTSGSTATPKFLPGTQATISAGCEATLARNAYLRRDHPLAVAGRPLVLVGSMAEGTTAAGVPFGAMTGFGYHVAHMGFEGERLPYEIFTVPDYEARYYAILRFALAARDLSAILVYNPSTVLRLLEAAPAWWDDLVRDVADGRLRDEVARLGVAPPPPDPERARELEAAGPGDPRGWWPRLRVLLCWRGGAASFYVEALRPLLGDLPVRELGLLASEAMVSVATDDHRGSVLLPMTGFFEFVPEGEDAQAARPAWSLDVGACYRLLVTTPGGLYRYDLADVVRVNGHHREMPRIEFLHRAGRVYSFTGEKLTEYQVTGAVRAAADACRVDLVSFTAVPTWGRPPFYEVLAEPHSPPRRDEWARLSSVIDDELQGVNMEYAGKRASGRLAGVRLTAVATGTFEKLRRDKRHGDAQYKEVHLATDPEYRRHLLPEEGAA